MQEKADFEEIHTADGGALSGLEGKNGVSKSNVDARVVDLKGAILQAYSAGTLEFTRAKAIAKTKFGSRGWEYGHSDDEGLFPELDVLHEWLKYTKTESDLRKEHKCKTDDLNEQVEVQYQNLTENEIRSLAIEDKWMASVEGAIGREVERLTGGLVDRIRKLERRYAEPLPELVRQAEDLEARVRLHLHDMGIAG